MDDELLSAFVAESREHLATIETDLLAIEEGGAHADLELINKVFRAAHSIKGTSGFFGFAGVKDLAHKAETILDMLRSRKMVINAEITNLLLSAFDALRTMIENPATSGEHDVSPLAASLTSLAASYLPQEARPSLTDTITLVPLGGGSPVQINRADYDAASARKSIYNVEYDLIHDVQRRGKNVFDVFHLLWTSGEILDCSIDFESVGSLDAAIVNRVPLRLVYATILDPINIDLLFPYNRDRVQVLVETTAFPTTPAQARPSLPSTPLQQPQPNLSTVAPKHLTSASTPSLPSVDDTLRVNVSVLERLMNLAGELVLGRNQLRSAIAQNNTRGLLAADQRVNQITTELQDVIMQTRLQPIGNVFGKFPRLVRDLAGTLGKEIDLEIRGAEVAMDKSLIEALSDPLTHMVRNAVDHGIETPEQRSENGKPRRGALLIEARHDAGQVVVEIVDDGAGIDQERVAKAAQSKGLVAREQLEHMSAHEKMMLIFLPGLSTASQVSDVSGRGVGMDVVKTNLDRLGGKVEIISSAGRGTTFRINLPLTLAIIPSLIVSVHKERFAIPQVNIQELLRVHPGNSRTRIEIVGGVEVLVLREHLIPLVRFSDLLAVVPTFADVATGVEEFDRRHRLADRRQRRSSEKPAQETRRSRTKPQDRRVRAASALSIVVVTTGANTYGLVVDGFHDTEEIVVKPLGAHLKHLREYAGATLLGDGTAALIVDIAGLATKAEIRSLTDELTQPASKGDAALRSADTHALLLFHNGPEQLCAVPVDDVLRISRIRPVEVEIIGGRRTMQYRGGSLPLLSLSDVARVDSVASVKELAVLISRVRDHEVGLLGTMPVDVVEIEARIDRITHRQAGIAGSLIINDRTALLADLQELVDSAWPEWTRHDEHPAPTEDRGVVLLAEDSDFFRAQVSRFLKEDGYRVLEAPDGEAAWDLLLGNLDYVRVVVTDIEMPRLDGTGLTRRIRRDTRTSQLPVIALTSLAGDDDVARIKAAGVNEYQTKLDRDRMLASVRRLSTCESELVESL